MKTFVLLMITIFALAACHGHVNGPDRARVYVPGGVVVETDNYGYGAGGPRHCPPGHAKKGWC